MKSLTFPLLLLLATLSLSNSEYIPSWYRCSYALTQQWYPYTVSVEQNPSLPEVFTISACGKASPLKSPILKLQSLLVNGTVGADYSWNSTYPYYAHAYLGSELCLNYTTYIPNLNEKSINLTIHPVDELGNDAGCISIGLQNQTAASRKNFLY